MDAKSSHARSERDRTDRSLEDERRKTDDELAKRRSGIDKEADAVVAVARERADEVLRLARARADRQETTAAERAGVDQERGRENEGLRQERATADEDLVIEREARRRILTALLAEERAHTDAHLLAERERMDAMIGSRDDFLAVVSHDLRNLLGGVALTAGALANVECEPAEVKHQAQRIQRAVARMTRLVGDLLDIVSIEAGRLAVAPDRHDARDLLAETLEVFQPIAKAKNISLTCEVRAGVLLAHYDYDRVLQVLANLVGNAIKFTPAGGRVELIVESIGDSVRFSVRDSGIGIERERLDSIFERFLQLQSSKPKRRQGAGLGLGLYISKCIVEAHGGRIWAESEGAGSTFCFTLPARDVP